MSNFSDEKYFINMRIFLSNRHSIGEKEKMKVKEIRVLDWVNPKKAVAKTKTLALSVFDLAKSRNNIATQTSNLGICKIAKGLTIGILGAAAIAGIIKGIGYLAGKVKNTNSLTRNVEDAEEYSINSEDSTYMRKKEEKKQEMLNKISNSSPSGNKAQDGQIKIKSDVDYTKSPSEITNYYESQLVRPHYKDLEKEKPKDTKKTNPNKTTTQKPVVKTETASSSKTSESKAKQEPKTKVPTQKNKPAANPIQKQPVQTQDENFITVKKGDCVWNIIKKDLKQNPDKYKDVTEILTKKLGRRPTRNQIINQVNIWTCKQNKIGNIIKPNMRIKISTHPPIN